MAIDFNSDFETLVSDLHDAGLKPVVVLASGGKKPRAGQVQLQENLSVHWDRDSHSVWVEGPWERAAKVERMIRRRRAKRRLAKSLTHPAMALRAVVIGLALATVVFASFKFLGHVNTVAANSSIAATGSSKSSDEAPPENAGK